MELFSLATEAFQNIAEHAASYRLGQSVLRYLDRTLWVVEKCARWAVPPPLDQDERPQQELVRPLPWLFFLVMLITLRLMRESISLINLVMGKPPLRSADVVMYIQSKRRYLRTLKYQGNRMMRARTSSSPSNESWSHSLRSLFEFTMCFRRQSPHYGNNNSTSVSNNDEVLVVKRAKRGREQSSPVASTGDTTMERLIEKMLVDLDAESDEDSFTLTNVTSPKSDRSDFTVDSDQDTGAENNTYDENKTDSNLEQSPENTSEFLQSENTSEISCSENTPNSPNPHSINTLVSPKSSHSENTTNFKEDSHPKTTTETPPSENTTNFKEGSHPKTTTETPHSENTTNFKEGSHPKIATETPHSENTTNFKEGSHTKTTTKTPHSENTTNFKEGLHPKTTTETPHSENTKNLKKGSHSENNTVNTHFENATNSRKGSHYENTPVNLHKANTSNTRERRPYNFEEISSSTTEKSRLSVFLTKETTAPEDISKHEPKTAHETSSSNIPITPNNEQKIANGRTIKSVPTKKKGYKNVDKHRRSSEIHTEKGGNTPM